MKGIGVSYRQTTLDAHYDSVVIGSGIGGLTTAALLARHGGRKVLVLERHAVAGGFTHVFHRPNYEWDVGVHYLGRIRDPAMDVRAAFDHLSGGELKWNPMADVYDRVTIGDDSFDFPAGSERFRAQMKAYFPSDGRAIDGYMNAVHAATKASELYFAEKAIPAGLAKVIGGALRHGFLRHARKTTAQAIAEHTRNPDLTAVLAAQWGNYGLPPAQSSFGMHALIAHHFFEGAGYPVGGASRIAATFAATVERQGGCIAVRAEVERILVDGSGTAVGVRMIDGREIRAQSVISDAGAVNTYCRLLPASISRSLRETELLRAIPPSVSHVCLYVGLRQAAGSAPFGTSNLWAYANRNHDLNFARFDADIDAPFSCLFISFPSAKDPTFSSRYPGRATIEVAAWAAFAHFAKWDRLRWQHRGAEYEALKHKLALRLLAELERHVPTVKGNIECWELSTPVSTRHFTSHPSGEIYGLAHTPARFEARWLAARTPIRNLLLTGQDAATCGLTGAMFGGVIAASNVLRRNMMAVVRRGHS